MELDLSFERVYPHPIESVWEAVSTREGLAAWLMENDFQPEVGRPFRFSFCPEDENAATTTVEGAVLEIDAPRRIAWSWRNQGESELTRVEITLTAVTGGTRFVLRHTGPISKQTGDALERGWPTKLEELAGVLGQ